MSYFDHDWCIIHSLSHKPKALKPIIPFAIKAYISGTYVQDKLYQRPGKQVFEERDDS